MRAWLQERLNYLEQGYLLRGGSAHAYEAQYLTYLECYVFATHGDPSKVLTVLHETRAPETPDGEPIRGFSSQLTGLPLVEALRNLRRRFEGPSPKVMILPRNQKASNPFDWLEDE